jgi:peptidoglycan/xylan/chitin deacetylase (PgdA/CDA1 family)
VKEEIVYDLKDDRWLTNVSDKESARKTVVLTIDDGPSKLLNTILDILQSKNVQVVFFWQARLLYKDRPWRRVLSEGHKIGSHAYNHKNLTSLTVEQQFRLIKNGIAKMEEVTGEKIQYFRPPYGQYNEDTMSILKELNLIPVMWEISSYDWENKMNREKIVTNVVDNIKDGSIILLHELEQTVAVLPEIIDKVREKGFDFVLF